VADCVLDEIGQLTPDGSGGWSVEIKLAEYAPGKAASGAGQAPKTSTDTTSEGEVPTPADPPWVKEYEDKADQAKADYDSSAEDGDPI